MSSKKIYHEVPQGFLINNLLQNKITENDHYYLGRINQRIFEKDS